jgi:UDP-glucose 4-epimerase
MQTSKGKKTILVTGGIGFIGSHTVVELISSLYSKQLKLPDGFEYDILIVDNLSNSNPKIMERMNQILDPLGPSDKKGAHFRFKEVELLELTQIDSAFAECSSKGAPIDYVIHFAAKKAVGESMQKPLLYFDNNFVGTLNVLKCMEKYDSKNFIFSSSATVYGPNRDSKEGDPLSFANPYGATKICVEHMIDATARCKPEWSVISLRYFNPCGAHPSGLIGESPQGFPNNLFPFIEEIVKGKRDMLSVFGNDYPTKDGTGVRDYLHVVDLAKAHVMAVNKFSEVKGYNIYNVGTGNGCSVLDIVNTYSRVSGKEIPYKIVERRPGDLDMFLANPEKANKELGWKAEKNLEDMCRDSYNWVKTHPNGFN